MDDVFIDAEGRPRRVRGVTVNSGSTLLVGLAAQVVETVLKCMGRAQEAGKRTGIFITPGALLDAVLEVGCDLVVCGGDVMDLATAWSNLIQAVPAGKPAAD